MQLSKPTYLFHITDYQNLRAISTNGLLSKMFMGLEGEYVNIAYDSVQGRRASIKVPCGKKGELHDYVPFYFAPRSPMLFCINKGTIQGYSGTQRDIIYLITTLEAIEKAGLSYTFTDGHAVMSFTQFYDKREDLDKIDWDIMKETYWLNTPEDGDRKRRRQAEFLIHQLVPWTTFSHIAVYNEEMKQTVTQLLEYCPHKPNIAVKASYYY